MVFEKRKCFFPTQVASISIRPRTSITTLIIADTHARLNYFHNYLLYPHVSSNIGSIVTRNFLSKKISYHKLICNL